MAALTIKELKEILSEIPEDKDDFPIFLQVDPEGNGYYELSGLEIGMAIGYDGYRPEDVYSSEAAEDPEEYFLEEGEYENNCFLVYP